MVVFSFSTISADSSIVILYFFEDFVFLGKSNSWMVSFTFTMSAMTCHPASVISQSPKINFLISCSMKFGVLRFVSGVSDHFERVVGVPLGVLLLNLLLDLLRDFLSVPERFGSWERRSLFSRSAVSTNWLRYHVSV